MSDLKPCPFCGNEDNLMSGEMAEGSYRLQPGFVFCCECGAEISERKTEAEAIEAWNKAMGASAEPERKKGKWQRRKDEDCWECSECHAVLENSDIGNHNFYYCYHCGADMMDICGYMDLEKANYE